MKKSKTQLSSGLHALLWKEGNLHVVKCLEIEVTSQGKTKKEALSNLEEALSLYFEDESITNPSPLKDVELHTVSFAYA
ncbi:TPA: HicB family protein [Patescibacteria group bacterium]|nr:HicB family protein [Patescibacteria group bacterium]